MKDPFENMMIYSQFKEGNVSPINRHTVPEFIRWLNRKYSSPDVSFDETLRDLIRGMEFLGTRGYKVWTEEK